MNLVEEKEKLIDLLEKFLLNQVQLGELNDFAWTMIDYFSNKNQSANIAKESFEKEFWYTIWQLQHIADNEHNQNGITEQAVKKSLSYLKNEKPIPDEYIGERP